MPRDLCSIAKHIAAALLLSTITTAASADIIDLNGLTQITPPSVITGNFLAVTNGPYQVIFPEKQSVMLLAPLVTDTGTIAAGTFVDSYFFAVNSFLGDSVTTSVTFNSNVLGIILRP
jgi:hypothetical protein